MLAALNGAPLWENARIEVEREDSRDFLELMIEAAPISLLSLSRQSVRLSLRSCSEKG